ncbi:TMV resistance protein N [Spatholobus suberectus]|nr:TMV resistance protein N [Spatholobus suberectus]
MYPGSDGGAYVVGICGDPGIGKKKIAHLVYDYLIACHGFHKCCFLGNVGEKLRELGLVHLPRMLLSEMVGNNYMGFANVEEGMSVIKHTLDQKKVLTILDGINCSDSLKAVVELTDCFGSGSLVLITAQDKGLLESHGIERIHEVKGLDRISGHQLLCLKAFSSMNMSVKYADIIGRAETYAAGNPLVLEVIGSCFRGKTVAECKFALDQYEGIPIADFIQNTSALNHKIHNPAMASDSCSSSNTDPPMDLTQLQKLTQGGRTALESIGVSVESVESAALSEGQLFVLILFGLLLLFPSATLAIVMVCKY